MSSIAGQVMVACQDHDFRSLSDVLEHSAGSSDDRWWGIGDVVEIPELDEPLRVVPLSYFEHSLQHLVRSQRHLMLVERTTMPEVVDMGVSEHNCCSTIAHGPSFLVSEEVPKGRIEIAQGSLLLLLNRHGRVRFLPRQ